jgi:hypothetical protein
MTTRRHLTTPSLSSKQNSLGGSRLGQTFDTQPPLHLVGREMPDAAFVGHGRDLCAFYSLIKRCNKATIRKNLNV